MDIAVNMIGSILSSFTGISTLLIFFDNNSNKTLTRGKRSVNIKAPNNTNPA